jgi:hypothetical protein
MHPNDKYANDNYGDDHDHHFGHGYNDDHHTDHHHAFVPWLPRWFLSGGQVHMDWQFVQGRAMWNEGRWPWQLELRVQVLRFEQVQQEVREEMQRVVCLQRSSFAPANAWANASTNTRALWQYTWLPW